MTRAGAVFAPVARRAQDRAWLPWSRGLGCDRAPPAEIARAH